MKKLSKTSITELDGILEKIKQVQGELKTAHTELKDVTSDYNLILVKYSEALQEGYNFAQDIAEQIQSYVDEKSEKWQEDEVGSAIQSWGSEWGDINFPEIDQVDIPELPNFKEIDQLEEASQDSGV